MYSGVGSQRRRQPRRASSRPDCMRRRGRTDLRPAGDSRYGRLNRGQLRRDACRSNGGIDKISRLRWRLIRSKNHASSSGNAWKPSALTIATHSPLRQIPDIARVSSILLRWYHVGTVFVGPARDRLDCRWRPTDLRKGRKLQLDSFVSSDRNKRRLCGRLLHPAATERLATTRQRRATQTPVVGDAACCGINRGL